ARAAAPFAEATTRADRVAALIATEAERSTSRVFWLLAISAVLGVAALRLMRVRPRHGRWLVPRTTLVVLASMPAFFALDTLQNAAFFGERRALTAHLAQQFTLLKSI